MAKRRKHGFLHILYSIPLLASGDGGKSQGSQSCPGRSPGREIKKQTVVFMGLPMKKDKNPGKYSGFPGKRGLAKAE